MSEGRNEFGDRVRAARKELGISQTEAAHLAGISPMSWRNYERGHQIVTGNTSVPIRPTRRIVLAIANALGWHREDALTWAGLTDTITDTDREMDRDVDARPPDVAELVSYWEASSPTQRRLLLGVAREFAEPAEPEQSGRVDDFPGRPYKRRREPAVEKRTGEEPSTRR